ncbi:MAG: hypothetical protein DMG49_12485 [Acidobacteria bacterium]|nr:MAG: hypothetical protein DMG49_12485 [Acidobacteriota bacterium]
MERKKKASLISPAGTPGFTASLVILRRENELHAQEKANDRKGLDVTEKAPTRRKRPLVFC